MKVLFVAPRYEESAGDGVYVKRLASALLRKDLELSVFSARAGRFVLTEYSGTSQSRTHDSLALSDELAVTDSGTLTKNFYSWKARASMKHVLQAVKPDLIHIHGIHQLFTISSLLELEQYGAPIVMTIHDYKIVCGNASFFSDMREAPCTKCLTGALLPPFFECCKRKSRVSSSGAMVQMAIWKYSGALNAIDNLLVGSKFVFDLLSANQNLSARLRLCRFPYPDLDVLAESDMKQEVIISFVGRFVIHKGILLFAQAVSDFQVPIHIFGDGDLMEDTRRILESNQSVFFHGWVEQREISKYLSPGSIVVVPSLAYETFCYAVVEAMMRGCCVVASGRGAIPELIRDGEDGVIVDPPTPSGFRSAIEALLGDRERIFTLGQQAKRITSILPNIDAHAEEVIDVYRTLYPSHPR